MNEIANPNQIAIDGTDFVGTFVSASEMYCSMTPKDEKEKAILFNATNNPDKRLADHINETIAVKDLFLETVMLESKDDPSKKEAVPRVVIIDDKGVSYQCVSFGIYSGFKKLIAVYGEPTWEKPVKIKVKLVSKGAKSLLTFDLVP